jgi:hypothetical protein
LLGSLEWISSAESAIRQFALPLAQPFAVLFELAQLVYGQGLGRGCVINDIAFTDPALNE